jgi:peptidoglycan hydrolase-like protein with peptidoglycan-binding domain
MKKLTLTLLAGAALAIPAMVPAIAQNTPQNQQPQQPNMQQPNMQQPNQPQASQQNPGQNQQASNQPISPRQLGHNGVRQVQQALAKHGFHSGRADGIWGHDTQTAVRDFQRSKGIQSKGTLNQQTLSDLGVNIASNDMGNQNNNQNGNPPSNQNQNK